MVNFDEVFECIELGFDVFVGELGVMLLGGEC